MQNNNSDDIEQAIFIPHINGDSNLKSFEVDMLNRIKNKASLRDAYDACGNLVNKNPLEDTPQMRAHVMINDMEPEMGTHWAIAAVHEPSTANSGDSEWDAPLGDLDGVSVSKTIKLDDESASYYDANIRFTYSDPMEGVALSNDASASIQLNFDVNVADLTAGYYNSFKAVNSSLSRTNVGSSGANGIVYSNNNVFNESYSLLSNKKIVRDMATGQLDVSGNAYQLDSSVNIQVVDADNANVIFGLLKIQQDEPIIEVNATVDPDVTGDTSGMTMVNYASSTQNDLPTSLTTSEFNALFDSSESLQVAPGYRMTVTALAEDSGGYTLSDEFFTGFSINDDAIVRNAEYMTALKDFADVSHSIVITNGNLVRGDMSENFMFSIGGGDEYLDSNYYNQNGTFRTWVKDSESRTLPDAGNSSNIPLMRITYPGETSAGTSVGTIAEEDARLTTYDVCYNVQVIIPSTDASSSYLGDEMLAKSNGAIAVITDAGSTVNFSLYDISFSAVSDLNTRLPATLNLFQIKQSYNMDQESGAELYSIANIDGVDTNIVYEQDGVKALTQVSISNANLASLQSNDIRVKLAPKTLNKITNWDSNTQWMYSNINDQALQSQKVTHSQLITQVDLDNLIANSNGDNSDQNVITNFNYVVEIETTTKSSSVGGLDYTLIEKVVYPDPQDVNNVITAKLEHVESEFQVNAISSQSTTVQIPIVNISGVTAYLKVTKALNNIVYRSNLGAYGNLSVQTFNFYSLTGEVYLKDANDNRLPDGFLKRFTNSSGQTLTVTVGSDTYTFNYAGNKSFRIISVDNINSSNVASLVGSVYNNSIMTLNDSLEMDYADLFGFEGIAQIKSSGVWTDLQDYHDVDVVLDIETDYAISYFNGTKTANVELNVDIPDDARIPLSVSGVVPFVNYYVELSNATGETSYAVDGKSYDTLQLSEFTSSWNALSDVSIDFFTSGGTTFDNLSAVVTKVDVSDSNPSDQNKIQLDIKKGQNTIFTFNTDGNMGDNFNIIMNKTPLIRVDEYIGDSIHNSYDINNVTQTTLGKDYMFVTSGVEVAISKNALVGDQSSFALLGDEIMCKPYPAYNGAYSTRSEITASRGLDIGDNLCRHVTLLQYRGVNRDETNTLTRSITSVKMLIEKGVVSYSQDLGSLYDGSDTTVTSLVNESDLSNSLGSLGLKVYGNQSMFDSSTVMKQYINVTHGTYDVDVVNPLNVAIEEHYTVQTNSFDIKIFETLKIRASRVKIYYDESYIISYEIPDLKVYHADADAVGEDASAYNYVSATLMQYSDEELREGVIINESSQLKLIRTVDNVQAFTEYYSLVRPQFKIAAISTNDVADVPYNASGVARQVSYCDIRVSENSYYPFSEYSGMNDFEVVQLVIDNYTDLHLHASESARSFNILGNSIYIKMSAGLSDSNYPTDNSSFVIYDGLVNEIALSNSDNLNASYSNELANFSFRQPMNLFVAQDIADRLTNLNIIVNDIHLFGTGEGRIDMTSGNSLKFKLYGSRIDRVVDGNDSVSLKYVFVKYETIHGFDYTTLDSENEELQVLKNIKFNADAKYEASVTIPQNNTLTDTAYNLQNILSDNNLSNSFAWVEDESFVPRQLQISVVSVSTLGLDMVEEWLAVDNTTRYKVLLLETPDMFAVRSLDGALSMKISYSGCVIAPSTRSYESIYDPTVPPFTNTNVDNANSENITDEFFAYNITSIAGN